MTLVFSGNDYKYEIEGVMKLFIPATLFDIVYGDEIPAGDHAFVRLKRFDNYALMYVLCLYNGKRSRKVSKSALDADFELILSRLLLKAMSEITGVVPKWGIITGIRPVKQVNRYLHKDMTQGEIYDAMQKDYLCSREKCEIALKTAAAQEKILDELDINSFSLYVSIPFCPTRCSYCSFVSQSIEQCMGQIPEYLDNLCKEIEYTGALVKKLGLKLEKVTFSW